MLKNEMRTSVGEMRKIWFCNEIKLSTRSIYKLIFRLGDISDHIYVLF